MSYTESLPTDRDWVRRLIGDTDPSDESLTDDEINAIVTEQRSTGSARKYFAAAMALEMLLMTWNAKGKGVAEKQVSKLRKRWGTGSIRISVENYIASLRAKGAVLSGKSPHVFRAVGPSGMRDSTGARKSS